CRRRTSSRGPWCRGEPGTARPQWSPMSCRSPRVGSAPRRQGSHGTPCRRAAIGAGRSLAALLDVGLDELLGVLLEHRVDLVEDLVHLVLQLGSRGRARHLAGVIAVGLGPALLLDALLLGHGDSFPWDILPSAPDGPSRRTKLGAGRRAPPPSATGPGPPRRGRVCPSAALASGPVGGTP